MNDIFLPRAVSYNLRSQIDLTRPNVNSEHFGISSLRHMTAKVWGMAPNDMKMYITWKLSKAIFFSRILLVTTGYLVSLYISNFIFYFIYNFIISFNFK